jgi:hypothetical protein
MRTFVLASVLLAACSGNVITRAEAIKAMVKTSISNVR